MSELPLVDDPRQATSRTQCPHHPRDPQWAHWQRTFAQCQSVDPQQYAAAKERADERIAAAGLRIGFRDLKITWSYDPEPWRYVLRSGRTVTVTVEALNKTFGQIAEAKPAPPPQRSIRGRPAGRQRSCHHGNPKGACRDCSTGRRR